MKRWISCLLTAAMVFSFAAQCPLITAKAAEPSSSSSDALAALGIDASVAPEGYDPDSLDNPYGRDTIAVTPVYELYTIGLDGNAGRNLHRPPQHKHGKRNAVHNRPDKCGQRLPEKPPVRP